MKILYVPRKFQKKRLEIIEQANEIIVDFQAKGYDLTVRQLYYQFVTRNYFANISKNYGLLQSTLNDARLAGLIDWDAIVDRSREPKQHSHWGSPRDIIETCADQYKIDTRSTQPHYIEVWVEKEALAEVVGRTCRELDILYFACKGYPSQSSMWEAANRHIVKQRNGRDAIVLHLGDHDPSGIHMTEDMQNRFDIFGSETKVIRIALNMDQVEKYNPPPNFAKQTDTRFNDYERKFGEQSWELDALKPNVIDELIKKHVNKLTDKKLLKAAHARQEDDLNTLADIVADLEE